MRQRSILINILLFFICSLNVSTAVAAPVAKSGNMILNPVSTTSLNVLRDCTYECSASEVNVTIVAHPAYGTLTVNAITKMVVYSHTMPGSFREDSFQYKISCNGEESNVGTIYLHPATKPDNMIEDVCHVDPEGFEWAIGQPQTSTVLANANRPWLVGDLDDINDPDNKGLPELVARPTTPGIGVVIFRNGDVNDGLTFDLQDIAGVSTEFQHYYMLCGIGLSRFSNGKGAVVVLNEDGYMYAFEYNNPNLTLKYKSDEPWVQPVTATLETNMERTASCISFADFDGDGNVEVYIGSKIFSLDGLQLLTSLGPTDNQGFSRQNANGPAGSGVSLALDIDRDGLQELIVGNEIYKIQNNGGVWSMSLYKTITPPDITVFGNTVQAQKDGRVSVADFNGDGHVDVLISYLMSPNNTRGTSHAVFYAWDVYNDQILFAHAIEDVISCSYPLIGDIDGDGELEIAGTFVFLDSGRSDTSELKAFKLPTSFGPSATLNNKWSLDIYESATRTGMSLFDFNLDGIMEIVYRDMENLRIMTVDGDSLKNLLVTPAGSGTTWEMPLIADIDNDGAAEIICVSAPQAESGTGMMQVYKSGNTYPWAPARKVWNQYAYNPTFVNEDLTIPRYPMDMATVLTDAAGVKRTPFNNFLQQAPIMNMDGVSLNSAPNLAFYTASPARLSYNAATDTMTVSFTLINNGDAVYNDSITAILYAYSPTVGYTRIGQIHTHGDESFTLSINNTVFISYTIADFSTLTLPADYDRWFLAVNAIDNSPYAPTYFAGQQECKEGDNLTSRLSFVSLEKVICEGETEVIELSSTYSYRWYDSYSSTIPLTTLPGEDNKLEVTKAASEVEYFFVSTYRKNNFSQPISQIRDTIFLYKASEKLSWTGAAEDGNWNNFENWEKVDVADDYPRANVPRACTDVIIPDGCYFYPVLEKGATTYDVYTKAECNNITIRHGGEVARPDSLHYVKAFVDIVMNANRWYMFSPPLKDFYSGDIYVQDPSPYEDDVIVYAKLFARSNPQNNYLAPDWTGNFSSPAYLFEAGNGLRMWVDDKKNDATTTTPVTFSYPKKDTCYFIYGPDSLPMQRFDLPGRTNAHRFIFDKMPDVAGNFTIPTSGVAGTGLAAGELWLVGNPFMAHLDFEKFYTANQGKIKDLYRIMTANGVYEYYNTGANTLPGYIAPMQSFIIEARDDISGTASLTFNAGMTVNRPGVKLRNIRKEEYPSLSISLMDETATGVLSQIFIIAEEGASNGYGENEDVLLVMNYLLDYTQEPTLLFSVSQDEIPQYLSVNRINSGQLSGLSIPLGLRSVKEGEQVKFLIQGQHGFPSEYELLLVDRQQAKEYDLRSATWFSFEITRTQEFLTDRFFIELREKGISSVPEKQASLLNFYTHPEGIMISSLQDEIQQVSIYDIQGRLITENTSVNTTSVLLPVVCKGIYIVKVKTENGVSIGKIVF